MTKIKHWHEQVGSQRDWVWRGWQTRYTYIRASQLNPKTTPVLLLHGFGASIGHWRQNMVSLGQYHNVYALDMLGFGASRKAQVNYKIDLWVEQVYDFWQTFIQQPIVLVGNSIGSLVCLAAAAAHPDMVKGVVMIGLPDMSAREEAMPKFMRPAVATIESLFASPLLLKNLFYLVRRPEVVRKWAAIAYYNPAAISDELVDILTGPAQDRGAAAAFGAILKAMIGSDFAPSVKTLLPNLEIPLLLIWGNQDRMIPPSLSRRFVELNANLQLVNVDNAGHCVHDECPEQVNQILLDWLDVKCVEFGKPTLLAQSHIV
ncbi:MAG: alpha/beta fold hydrolase [Leptolyngbyaceae cyanobacterium CAN_BIN12]|nr:alpha/beta fold hydrolase [Leptolyngbyaceae cyanobacterium CAN_BIN12]